MTDLIRKHSNDATEQSQKMRQTLLLMPDDVLHIIVSELDGSDRTSEFYPMTNGDPLLSLRLVNQFFSLYTTPRVFKFSAIGKNLHKTEKDVPPNVLKNVRYLSIHPFASDASPQVWAQFASSNIIGIRYVGNYAIPIILDLGKYISLTTTPISVLALEMASWSVIGRSLHEFEEVIRLLSSSVRRLSMHFGAYDYDSLKGLTIIQRLFGKLVSIQLLNMDIECSDQALDEGWLCLSEIEELVIYESCVSFSQLSNLIDKATSLNHLTLEQCFPWNSVDGKGVIAIPASRQLESTYIHPVVWQFDLSETITVRSEIKRI